jgi:hypothetical protein
MATHALENGFENPQNDDGRMMIVCTSARILPYYRVHVLVAIAANACHRRKKWIRTIDDHKRKRICVH